jgi:hypothetical protein
MARVNANLRAMRQRYHKTKQVKIQPSCLAFGRLMSVSDADEDGEFRQLFGSMRQRDHMGATTPSFCIDPDG